MFFWNLTGGCDKMEELREECKMFREMRRKAQQLSREESLEILREGTSGVLSLFGDRGYPYGVPMSYTYEEGKLYFHSAVTGHKVDAIKNCEKASFCVIALDDVQPEALTTNYKSVIAFGGIRILTGDEKLRAILSIGRKYSSVLGEETLLEEIRGAMDRMILFTLEIRHLTGKQGKGLL